MIAAIKTTKTRKKVRASGKHKGIQPKKWEKQLFGIG